MATVPKFEMSPNSGDSSHPIYVKISDSSIRALGALSKKGALGGGSGGGAGSAGADGGEGISIWRRMLKTMAGIGAMVVILKQMERNSQVLNAYQSALGKTFGAAMDVLLMPFLPIFNLLLVGINKLIVWLISSGMLAKIQKVMEQVAKNIEGIFRWFKDVFSAIFRGDIKELGRLIVDGIKDAVKSMFGSKTGFAAAMLTPSVALGTLGMFGLLGKGAGLGGAIRGAALPLEWMIGLGKWGWGKKFGGKAAPPGAPGLGTQLPLPGFGGPMGAGGAGGAGAGRLAMASGGLLKFAGAAGAGLTVATAGTSLSSTLLNNMGVKGQTNSTLSNAAGWGMGGATAGFMVGGPVGAAIGGLLGLVAGGIYGHMKGKNQQGGPEAQAVAASGGSITNSYNKNSHNVINVTITQVTSNPNQAVNETIAAVERKTGYQLKSGAGTLSGYSLPSKSALTWRQAAVLGPVALGAKAIGAV